MSTLLAESPKMRIHFEERALFTERDLSVPAEVSSGKRQAGDFDLLIYSFQTNQAMKKVATRIATEPWGASHPEAWVLVISELFQHHPQKVTDFAWQILAQREVELDVVSSKDEAKNAIALHWAKLIKKHRAAPEKPAPQAEPRLHEIPELLAATADLRDATGRLNIDLVAKLFDLPRATLARAVGTTSQAAAKTPNSERLQAKLLPFERIARLRAVSRDDASFLKWLNQPNPRLQGKAPIALITAGRPEPVAAIVDNFLTGATS